MKRPHAFITGIAGFAGSFLAEELLAHGYTVSGSTNTKEPLRNLKDIQKKLNLVELDITNAKKTEQIVIRLKPDYMFHLAAIASVGKSFEMERLTFDVNLSGTVNLLEAAKQTRSLKRFLFVGSADCYGKFSPVNKTLRENQPLNPISPYGISKAAAEQTSLYYFRQHGLPVVITRAFTHSGPRQTDSFFVPSFAKQVAMIEAGIQKPIISVGDLSARRDISDVRDIVSGYRLAVEKGVPGEIYQLSSGKSVEVKKLLEGLVSLSSAKIKVGVDKARLRKSDIPILRGDNRKAVEQLGYKSRYSVRETLQETLQYWRTEVRSMRKKG